MHFENNGWVMEISLIGRTKGQYTMMRSFEHIPGTLRDDIIFFNLSPDQVRALHKAFRERDWELIKAGFLEVEGD